MYTHGCGCVCRCGVLCFLVKYDVLLRSAIYNNYCDKGCLSLLYTCFVVVDIYLYFYTMSMMYKNGLWFTLKLSSLLTDQFITFLLSFVFWSYICFLFVCVQS